MKNIVILISGRGSNMQAILEARLPLTVAAVISNDPKAGGLATAQKHGIATRVVDHRAHANRAAFDTALSTEIDAFKPDLVVLAGFMRILTGDFVNRYRGRLINIHPSLLPSFTGLDTHRRALEAGVKVHGCTVHFVTPELDHGPIIIQAAVAVLESDSEVTLAARVLAEHQWAVALPDLRGHGRSEGQRGHSNGWSEVSRDLRAVQDHLAYRLPDAPKVLIGQGLGALYALNFALEHPEDLSALVLLAPRWHPDFQAPKPASGMLRLFKKPAPTDEGCVGNQPSRLTNSDAERHAWGGDPLVHDSISRRAVDQSLEIAARCRGGASQLRVPTLLLHGAKDSISDPAHSRAFQSPCVELRVLDDLAHDLLHERGADRLVDDIVRWLGERQSDARS